jgi:outer membrane protein OmpA-like peptidoglycan-associated protein
MMPQPAVAALWLIAALALGSADRAMAADACTGNLSPDQIKSCLGGPVLPRQRGIRLQTGTVPTVQEVNLTIHFEFNSARLTATGTTTLEALGTALADPTLKGGRFRIAGHTDAVGSEAYNQRLSEQRAATVRTYLVEHFAIDAARLETVGYGKSRLYDAQNPSAAVNRRVQISRLADAQ